MGSATRRPARIESNQADGIFRHLADLGYTLTPLTDWDAAFFRFSVRGRKPGGERT